LFGWAEFEMNLLSIFSGLLLVFVKAVFLYKTRFWAVKNIGVHAG